MKTIGLIGGMSWESTVTYYEVINEKTKEILGGLHSAKILLYSVDFAEIEQYQVNDEWDKSAKLLADVAVNLQNAGADLIVICTNTMHKVAPQVAQSINIPLLHIADATAREITRQNINKVALLGTKYTMTQDFYKQKLIDSGIEVIVPSESDIEDVHNIIFNELCVGKICDAAKRKYIEIIDKMQAEGAQGVVLGCTEIGLLIGQKDVSMPVFDTTIIHAQEVVKLALAD